MDQISSINNDEDRFNVSFGQRKAVLTPLVSCSASSHKIRVTILCRQIFAKSLRSSQSRTDHAASVTCYCSQAVFLHLQHRFFSDKKCWCGKKQVHWFIMLHIWEMEKGEKKNLCIFKTWLLQITTKVEHFCSPNKQTLKKSMWEFCTIAFFVFKNYRSTITAHVAIFILSVLPMTLHYEPK